MARERSSLIRNTALYGAVFLVIIDRLAKSAALALWHEPIDLIPNTVRLVLSKNIGIAFSIGTHIDPLYLIVPIVLLVIILGLRAFRRGECGDACAFAVIFLGAASNLYDRIAYGFVIDYIDISFFSVLNLADVLITAGVAWLLFRQRKSGI